MSKDYFFLALLNKQNFTYRVLRITIIMCPYELHH